MPIYEYCCDQCGGAFETLVPNASAPLPTCPACGSKKVKKQFSSFAATVAAAKAPSCSMGKCPSGSCAGGGCPMERR